MSNFFSGSRFIAVIGIGGPFSKDQLIKVYSEIIGGMEHNQPQRAENDVLWLKELGDAAYYLILRQRTGCQSEYESVTLTEYGLKGRYPIAWESEFIVWDQKQASNLNEFIKYVAIGDKKEVTGCQQP